MAFFAGFQFDTSEMQDKVSGIPGADVSNFHITLHYFGKLRQGEIPDLQKQISLTAQSCTGLSVHLGPPILFPQGLLVLPVTPAPGLRRIKEQLTQRLQLKPDRSVYRPHVTLTRQKFQTCPPHIQELEFTLRLESLSLMSSRNGKCETISCAPMMQQKVLFPDA